MKNYEKYPDKYKPVVFRNLDNKENGVRKYLKDSIEDPDNNENNIDPASLYEDYKKCVPARYARAKEVIDRLILTEGEYNFRKKNFVWTDAILLRKTQLYQHKNHSY